MNTYKRVAFTLGLLILAAPCFAQLELATSSKDIWGITLKGNFNHDYTEVRFAGYFIGSGRVLIGASFGSEAPSGSDGWGIYRVNVEILAVKSSVESKLPSVKLLFDYTYKSWDHPIRFSNGDVVDGISQSATLKSIGATVYRELKLSRQLSLFPQVGIGRVGFSGDELRGESSTTVWEIATPLRLLQREGGVLLRPYFTYETYKKRPSFGIELSFSAL